MVQTILDKGWAYESNGSVYFDVTAYNANGGDYGILSGRKMDELQAGTRALDGQEEKRNPAAFAIWQKASSTHIMRWPSPWSIGFPGWHLECSAMSTKYLGETFDIHGGGMDLKFPHHECEIAQAESMTNQAPVNYWLHANMLTLNGKKMAKSTGNNILPEAIFPAHNAIFTTALTPSVVRYLLLHSPHRSILDLTDAASSAPAKEFNPLPTDMQSLTQLTHAALTTTLAPHAWEPKR